MKEPLRILCCAEAARLLGNCPDAGIIGIAVGGEELVEKIACTQPDLVILSLFMPGCDAIEIIRAYRTAFDDRETRFAVMCPLMTNNLRRELNDCGVERLLAYPYRERDFEDLLSGIRRSRPSLQQGQSGIHTIHRIHRMYGITQDDGGSSCGNAVEGILDELGVERRGPGFGYLKRAVMLAAGSWADCSVTRTIYPAVAEEYHTTPSRVERCIRSSITEAWRSDSGATMAAYFGHTVDNLRGKPSNCEFIAMLADRICLGSF